MIESKGWKLVLVWRKVEEFGKIQVLNLIIILLKDGFTEQKRFSDWDVDFKDYSILFAKAILM